MDTYLRGGVCQPKTYGDDGFMQYVEYVFELHQPAPCVEFGCGHYVVDHLLVREELCSEKEPAIMVFLVTADGPTRLDEATALIRVQDVFNDLFAKTRADVERRHRLAAGAS
jgi:hypothetical protein